jgi:murein DD-endopeptidase MepM/ murein hydrolase activator NlpD
MKFKIIFSVVISLIIGFMLGYTINVQKDKSQTKLLIQANQKYRIELNQMQLTINSILAENVQKSKYFQPSGENKSDLNFTATYSELQNSQMQFINKSQYIPDKIPVTDPIITKLFHPEQNHYGIDLAGKRGDPICAAASGVVKNVKNNDSVFGKCLEIDHLNGYTTFYGHNSKIIVREGYFVKKGEKIAEIGQSGQSSAPHLHFEISNLDKKINPITIIK